MVGLELGEIARRLAAAGAKVVLVGADAGAAGSLLARIEAEAGPGRAAYFQLPGVDSASGAPAAADPVGGASRAGGVASSGPTGSELEALVELVAELWPAR